MTPEITPARGDHGSTSFWDQRPEWTGVSFGRNYRVTAAVAGKRILVTRSMGYASVEDVPDYAAFIGRVVADGIGDHHRYVHVFDWSVFSGGTLAARNRTIQLFRSQKRLHGVVFCNVTGILRMTMPLTLRLYRFSILMARVDDLTSAIRKASEWLSITPPEPLIMPSMFAAVPAVPETPAPGLPSGWPSAGDGLAPTVSPSDAVTCRLRRIGNHLSYGRIERGALPGTLNRARILEILGGALTAEGHHQTAQAIIWEVGGIETVLPMADLGIVLEAVLSLPRPSAGTVLVGGWRTRWLVFRHQRRRPLQTGTLSVATSVARALALSQRRLMDMGFFTAAQSPAVQADPAWTIGDSEYSAQSEIIDGDIIHSVCSGFFRTRHVQPALDIQRRLMAVMDAVPEGYYLLADVGRVRGGSQKARRLYVQQTRALFREHPFRMFVFYGATGFTQAAIHLARQAVPYRVEITPDLDTALALIRADRIRRAAPGGAGSTDPPLHSAAVQRYVDDLLQYLGSVNWDLDDAGAQSPEIPAGHPFAPVFEAIDLIKYDLVTLFNERKEAEKAQRELEDRLAQSRKMEALGLLAGGVAHDLNNVLSGIVSYPDLLLMDISEDSPLRVAVETIRKAGQRASAIVQDLLTMARRSVANLEVLNINDVIRDYLESPEHRSLCREYPRILVSSRLDPHLLNVKGAVLQLKSALMNLVRNGVESHDGRGEVTILTENRHVDQPIGAYDDVIEGDYAVLEVRDRGGGIAPEDLPRIFEPFYTKKMLGRSGTGLGMTIVWGTVQDHGGYIDVSSSAVDGTTITVYLPATREAVPRPADARAEIVQTGRGQRILVVDDMQEQRDIASRILERLGYSVFTAPSGEAALELLAGQSMDLVIMDMIMDPGMDGLDACRHIWERWPDQKVIILSGFAENERIAEVRRLGVAACLVKPYKISAISEAVADALAAGPASP